MGNQALYNLPHHLMIITLPQHNTILYGRAAGGLVKRTKQKKLNRGTPTSKQKEAEKRNPNLRVKETENEESQPQSKRD